YAKAVELGGDESSALLLDLGIGYVKSGQWAEAKDALTKCAELMPSDARVHEHLGLALAKLDALPAAERSYQTAVELDDARGAAKKALAEVRVALGKKDAAVE